MALVNIAFTINGQKQTVKTDQDCPLLEVIREDLHLMGTRYGCGEAQCGCCSVLVDGRRVFSCVTPVSAVEGKSITTIEGLSHGQRLHPLQQAFLDEAAFQCAYCTSGMIIAAASLLNRITSPTEKQIIDGMNGNVCRCCAQPQIVKAVKKAAAQIAEMRP